MKRKIKSLNNNHSQFYVTEYMTTFEVSDSTFNFYIYIYIYIINVRGCTCYRFISMSCHYILLCYIVDGNGSTSCQFIYLISVAVHFILYVTDVSDKIFLLFYIFDVSGSTLHHLITPMSVAVHFTVLPLSEAVHLIDLYN